jgi:hypothetical protein
MALIRPSGQPSPKPPPGGKAKPPTDSRAGIEGRNLSQKDLFALLDWYADQSDLPAEVLRAIALQESSGRQWDKDGKVVVHHDGTGADWGVMQINDARHGLTGVDIQRLKSDERYNIEVGARKTRAASDHCFTQKYGHPFSMRWYASLTADQQRTARLDLFRAYNGWLPKTSSNALPYERRIETGEVHGAKTSGKKSA